MFPFSFRDMVTDLSLIDVDITRKIPVHVVTPYVHDFSTVEIGMTFQPVQISQCVVVYFPYLADNTAFSMSNSRKTPKRIHFQTA